MIMEKTTSKSDLPKLAQPAQRALANAGIQNLKQLTKFSEQEIKQLHGIGPNALVQLHQALAERGWSFAREEKATSTKSRAGQTKGATMKKTDSKANTTASQHIDNYLTELDDWRGTMLTRLRRLILNAAPELTEEWKWDIPVWSYKGNVVAGGVFKDHIKLNFFKGASLEDPKGLFNAGLDAKATRAIDISEDSAIDEAALKELVRAAVAYNGSGGKKK
jgi:hypothetical protein